MAPQIATHSPNDTSNTRISASPRFSHKTALGSERTDGRGSTATLQQSGGQARSAPIFVHLLLASRPEQRERLFSIAEAQLRLPEAHPDPGDSGRAVPGERGGVGRPSNRDNQGSKLGAAVGVKCGIGGPSTGTLELNRPLKEARGQAATGGNTPPSRTSASPSRGTGPTTPSDGVPGETEPSSLGQRQTRPFCPSPPLPSLH